jgi:hypothetical protein
VVVFSSRKFQRMAALLQRIQGQVERAGGQVETGTEQDLREAARQAGTELDLLRLLDPATLERSVVGSGEPDPGRCWAVAEVCYLDGLMARARGDGEGARDLLEKARRLFGHATGDLRLPEGTPPPETRLRRIRELGED